MPIRRRRPKGPGGGQFTSSARSKQVTAKPLALVAEDDILTVDTWTNDPFGPRDDDPFADDWLTESPVASDDPFDRPPERLPSILPVTRDPLSRPFNAPKSATLPDTTEMLAGDPIRHVNGCACPDCHERYDSGEQQPSLVRKGCHCKACQQGRSYAHAALHDKIHGTKTRFSI